MNPPSRQDQLAKELLAESAGDVSRAIEALQKVALQPAPLAQTTPTTQQPAPVPTPQLATPPTPTYTPKSTEVVAKVTQLNKQYKVGHSTVQALNNVSLSIYKGEFVALTGTSGSGKSTLLQMLGGLDKPSSGTVEIAGQNLARLKDHELSRFRNKTIGFVFQFFYLQPFLTLQTNIEVPAMFARTKRKERNARSQQLATTVGLNERLGHLPKELSGGQMQRAAIARALQNQPGMLLADEPTGNLDRQNALAIFQLFRSICNEQGMTVVVVTHDMELAAAADRIIKLQDGVIQ